MITGHFDPLGRPLVEGVLFIPRLGLSSVITFLLDTGSGSTLLHPEDASNLQMPFHLLQDRTLSRGIGGHPHIFANVPFWAFAT
jgi:hypothetical protein